MPDWSYHPLFKPLLFQVSASKARNLTLRGVATLGSMPGGTVILDFMGNMTPSADVAFRRGGFTFPSRVGLGAGLASSKATVKAFERFGFGFIELGPVTVQSVANEGLTRDNAKESIACNDVPYNEGLDAFVQTCLATKGSSVPTFVRVAHIAGTAYDTARMELQQLHERLPNWVIMVIDSRWCLLDWDEDDLKEYLKLSCSFERRIVLAISPDVSEEIAICTVRMAIAIGVSGISITGGVRSESGIRTFGKPTFQTALRTVGKIRSALPDILLIGSGGIIEPADALAMFKAGADLVSVYSGFVFSGPGLPKRINEAVTAVMPPEEASRATTDMLSPYSIPSVINSGWVGIALVGAGLIVTGASAITVALTTVILPYDEKFLGITRAAMIQLNPHLLPFMSHDRVTYAGAGMSNGLLFAWLCCFGAREGQHWAYLAARVSCAFGFASFLLFLGFHYLDPLHALVTFLMLPLFLWALIKRPRSRAMRSSNVRNSSAWHKSLIGQLLFVGIGFGLVLAGFTICKVGTSTVFVPEDLMFMGTTAKELLCHNDHLLPTIAHDRAGFGGSLVTAGFAVLLTSLYGFRQGEGWVWWMLLISGLPGFLSTLGIHYAIGYTSFIHLLPAYIATVMFVSGLTLSYRYLCVEPGRATVRPWPDGETRQI